ncbi:hypothetical protein YA62_023205 [Agrobacterium sp. LC34]|nr:hypothetical protein YA62_023205 [Agrobacterium sp. LC34]
MSTPAAGMVLKHFLQKRNRFYVRTIREIKEIELFVVEGPTVYGITILQDGASPCPSFLCLSQESSRRASARREGSFQPKDLGWLDPCDKHREEGR